MVAVRTDYLFRTLPPGQWLDYEEILRAPDLILNRFLARWDLEPFDFLPGLEVDHNVAGRAFQREDLWKEYFDGQTIAFLDRLFRVMGRR